MNYGDFADDDNGNGTTSIQDLRQKADVKNKHIKTELKKIDEEDDYTTDDEQEIIKPKKKAEKLYDKIPEFLKEPLLILVIYIVFSLPFIRQAIGNNIKYINPSEEGEVPFIGIVIYGVIVVGTYMLIKKLFM